jgi:hypothetical protein
MVPCRNFEHAECCIAGVLAAKTGPVAKDFRPGRVCKGMDGQTVTAMPKKRDGFWRGLSRVLWVVVACAIWLILFAMVATSR